jgi:hypothetical protein
LRIPAKARIDAYSVQERFGWIRAFIGDLPERERPPLTALDWVDDPAVSVVRGHSTGPQAGTGWSKTVWISHTRRSSTFRLSATRIIRDRRVRRREP